MNKKPILMEDYFNPGFKTKPAVLVGSQTVSLFHGIPEEQAWEGCLLAGATGKDLPIVRNIESDYLTYWNLLMGKIDVINLMDTDRGKYLTEVLLDDSKIIAVIKKRMHKNSRLMVFLPTSLEQRLADRLNIPLHGSPRINKLYGTKSGIRILAKEAHIPMSPGYICKTYDEVKDALNSLSKLFTSAVIKHDLSLSGYFSKKIELNKIGDIRNILDQIAGGSFTNGKDIVVVEGWLKNKASLCAHIEILPNQPPIICGGWQQIIDSDGISYMGAGPLMLSKKALQSFLKEVRQLADKLQEKGAIGSYGPDFLIAAHNEAHIEPDTCILLELNARVPYTAFPLEIIKQVKGKIGEGFCAQHIKLSSVQTFSEIFNLLKKENLLIMKKNNKAEGVVPYNIGLLPYKLFDVVAMADTWTKTISIVQKVKKVLTT